MSESEKLKMTMNFCVCVKHGDFLDGKKRLKDRSVCGKDNEFFSALEEFKMTMGQFNWRCPKGSAVDNSGWEPRRETTAGYINLRIICIEITIETMASNEITK